MSNTNRTVELYESAYDLNTLSKNGFNFGIAKSVIGSDGSLTFNVVWRSLNLQPRSRVQWTVQYGLNWTLDLPTGNATVTVGGVWQACNPGESYDVTSNGEWVPSAGGSPKADYLNVGDNNYQYSGMNGIHIIVGVKTPGGDFEPIYIDNTELTLGMSSWYQPQEKCMWWYEKGLVSSSMISGDKSRVCKYDMTEPSPQTGEYYVSTTFSYATGAWSTSYDKPPAVAETGLLGANLGETDTDQLHQDLRQLITAVNALVKVQGTWPPARYFFRGTATWPAAATRIAITAGATLISGLLIQKGYSITRKETSPDGHTIHWEISPPAQKLTELNLLKDVPPQVLKDWHDAVGTDAKDGAMDKGVTPVTSF